VTAFGSFSPTPDDEPRLGLVREGRVVDLRHLADGAANLDPVLRWGVEGWRALDEAAEGVSTAGGLAVDEVTWHLPFTVRDYVDFYSSIEHATNLGRILRPDGEPLLPNWRHLPVGYHGRAGTVVVSGTTVTRPCGQTKAGDADGPTFGPSRMLDVEVEVGFVTGDGPSLGTPIPVDRAEDHIFGLLLVNDWSARDLQSWEYQPLGPFLAKSFATSISPWVVPLRALSQWRVDGPRQDPAPLPYLRAPEPRGLALDLQLLLRTPRMVAAGDPRFVVASTGFAGMYWSMSQQLAHLTVNGATIRAGDLCASGTVSGSTVGSEGSLMERTWRGTRPLVLPNGEERGFLEDGDEVTIAGRCGSLELGPVVGTIEASLP
jgi:fumarylacetoacetase